jgi:hypothetical protein
MRTCMYDQKNHILSDLGALEVDGAPMEEEEDSSGKGEERSGWDDAREVTAVEDFKVEEEGDGPREEAEGDDTTYSLRR